ncbi:hypothetical protein GEU84_018355 [Fertoebacter nigrum]|uniref:Uncharacterized protein n=1 Tax=Fertoeibacter niger TaxID=2656921 RepID=A0A8X8H615_9RHOB|nr:hypothetical protein [Fertoeibacter niger]NUB46358.1 hypothetical protein [Fertoeibacter niger]
MTLLASALTALLLLGGPAAAGSVATDLPHLTWPQDETPTVTRGCGAAATAAPTCAISE